MNKFEFVFFSVLLLSIVSCKHKSTTDIQGDIISSDSVDLIVNSMPVYIDKDSDYVYRKEILLEDLADVEYIRLEATDECYIKNIQQLLNAIYLDNNNIFVSTASNSVLRFDSNGKFLNTIGQKGQGPGEFASLFSIKINPEKKEVYLLDSASKRILVYDYNGAFRKAVSTKVSADDFYYTGTDTILLVNKNPAKEPMAYVVNSSSGIVDTLLPPHETKSGMQGFMFDYLNKNKLYKDRLIINSEVSDTIFEVDPTTLKAVPKYIQLPPNKGVGGDNTSFYLVFETDRYANFAILKDNQIKTTYWVDKVSKEVFTGLIWNDDMQQFPLPVNTNQDNKVALMFYAERLINLNSKGKLKGQLKELASGLDPDDNPILMIATFKP